MTRGWSGTKGKWWVAAMPGEGADAGVR